MGKVSSGIAKLNSILIDVNTALNSAIDVASGAKKVRLKENKKVLADFKKNAHKYGKRETRRRDATDQVSGETMPGASRVTKSTGEVTAIVGPKRLKELANDIVAGKMNDRRSAIKKGLAWAGVTGVAGGVAGNITANKTKPTKTKQTKTKTLPMPKPKPKRPPKPKPNPRTKNRKASKSYNIKT